ncbi:MAG: Crp/Fnr family transcriptional regulator [Flavobacteriales bacterium]|nr:Crp/Fnr family transcriptional regulator [Flavobacteriales bacterium]
MIAELESSPRLRIKLNEIGERIHVKKDEIIQANQSYIRSIPIVTKGNLKVLRIDETGNEILLYYIHPGETCIMSFLGGIHNEKSKIKAMAEEDSEILMVPVSKLNLLMKDFPEWLEYVFRLYNIRFEELLETVEAVAFKKMDERLYDFLLRKTENSQSNEIQITHEQIANELGTARTVISRLLKQMEEKGLLKLKRNKIELLK